MPTEDLSGSNALWFPTGPGISSIAAVSLPKTAVYATDENNNQVLVRYDVTVSKLVPVWNQSILLTAPLKVGVTVGSLPYALSNTAALMTFKTLVKLRFTDEADPIPLASIVYSQSSVWEDNTAANATNMQDGSLTGTATGTNNEALAWVKMDFGATYEVAKIVIGTATTALPGGWNKSYTENNDIEYSTNGTTWTNGGTTGTFASEGIYEIAVSFSARYVRISRADDYLALCELYALAIGQTV